LRASERIRVLPSYGLNFGAPSLPLHALYLSAIDFVSTSIVCISHSFHYRWTPFCCRFAPLSQSLTLASIVPASVLALSSAFPHLSPVSPSGRALLLEVPLETFTGGVDEAENTHYVLEDGNLGDNRGGGGLDATSEASR
jgi:hypothetical protein